MTFLRHVAAPVLGLVVTCGFIGCAASQNEVVPSSAQLASEGNKQLTYTAPHDGMVYIYDTDANKLIYSGRVDHNDVISANSNARKVMVNGRLVADQTFDGGHTLRLFYDRSTKPDTEVTVQKETIIREPNP